MFLVVFFLLLSIAKSQAVAMARVACTADDAVLLSLVKANVGSIADDRLYMNIDDDAVAANYSNLINAIASVTSRLNRSKMSKACQEVFGANNSSKRFADRIVDVFNWCRKKMAKSVNGTKASPQLKGFIAAIKTRESRYVKPQLPFAVPKTSAATSSSSTIPSLTDVYKMHGLEPPVSDAKCVVGDAPIDHEEVQKDVVVISSQELSQDSVLNESLLFAVFGGASTVGETCNLKETSMETGEGRPEQTCGTRDGDESGTVMDKPVVPHWVNAAKLTVDQIVNSEVVSTPLTRGENGFLVARLGGDTTFETDLPNLMLQTSREIAMKRPAAHCGTSSSEAHIERTLGMQVVGQDPQKSSPMSGRSEAITRPCVARLDEKSNDDGIHKQRKRMRLAGTSGGSDVVGADGCRLENAQGQMEVREPTQGQVEVEHDKHADDQPSRDAATPMPMTWGKMWYKNGSRYGVRQKFGEKKQVWQVSCANAGVSQEDLGKLVDMAMRKMEAGELTEANAKTWVLDFSKKVLD